MDKWYKLIWVMIISISVVIESNARDGGNESVLRDLLQDFLEKKAKENGLDLSGTNKQKKVSIIFNGATAPEREVFSPLYLDDFSDEPSGTNSSNTGGQTSIESQCYNLVQGKVAWNSSGNKSWTVNSVKKLCAGATSANVPPTCFRNALRSNNKMNWSLATQLCVKAKDAVAPIRCLKRQLTRKLTLNNAVNACDANPVTIAILPAKKPTTVKKLQEEECFAYIQGRIAWDAKGKRKQWNPSNAKRLCKGSTSKFSPGNCFTYAMHKGVAWGKKANHVMNWSKAIDLCEGTSNAQQTTGCFKNAIASGRNIDQAIAKCDR